MLRFLRIEHLAVIDALEVEFEPGLNVLTGETGAGKSMLVEAVGLLLGDRASADLVRTGESSAHVEAIFECSDSRLPDRPRRPLMPLVPLTDDHIIRREITAQGRSRAFVNGALVTAAALGERTAPLIELHGQHEHQTLLDPQSHLILLDDSGGLTSARLDVGEAFQEWQALQREHDALQVDEREKAARIDFLTFQLRELDKADVRPAEDEALETSRRVLGSADKLQRLCGEAYAALYDSDEAALAQLGVVWKRVGELAAVDPIFQPYLDAREAIKSQLEDLAFTLRNYRESIDAAPDKLQQVEDRLALIDRLKRKYGPTLDAVIASRTALSQQLTALHHVGDRRTELAEKATAARDTFLARARSLSTRRREAATRCAGSLRELLAELAMEKSRFEWRFDDSPSESTWTENGVDVVQCYFSANVGEDLRPLARIASGGELSRVMLAIRTMVALGSPGKTLIFDEVDAGIGGRVADVVGRKLRRLGESFQVLCITHLPQIAAAGHAHFHISKTVVHGRTQTRVVQLGKSERVEELARMIGGASPTDASRAAARELLRGGESERIPKGESESHRAKTAK